MFCTVVIIFGSIIRNLFAGIGGLPERWMFGLIRACAPTHRPFRFFQVLDRRFRHRMDGIPPIVLQEPKHKDVGFEYVISLKLFLKIL